MKNVVITLSEKSLKRMDSVIDMLRKDGLKIEKRFDFGVVTGKVEEKNISKLRRHKDVISISEDRRVQIAPPESEIQ